MKILVRGGTLYSKGRITSGDLLVEDGVLAAVGDCRGLAGGAAVVEAGGCHVLPGLIDLHVHIDDTIGRYRLADTWESGSRAAAAAGITTLGGFITQKADEPLSAAVERAEERANGSSFCDYLWHLTPTRFPEADGTEVRRLLESGWRTFKFYTTYRRAASTHPTSAWPKSPSAWRRETRGCSSTPKTRRSWPRPGLRCAGRCARRTTPGCGRPRPSCGRSSASPM